MTNQPVEANVVLTADNSAYDQAMVTSAGSTNDLTKSLDSLGAKINSLSKTAGKSLLGITAADVTLIGGATAAWASYEKQMSRLEAQAAIRGRTLGTERQSMKDYTAAVKGLRTEYGTSTGEAAKLVETLSKVTATRQTRDLTDLSKVFVDMSKATGESSEGLASSLTNLQKVMGTDISSANTRKYADMFTYLSAQTNTTAQGLVDFTAQLAPLGQEMGLNTKQIAGFATAFTNAGQEGIGAATVFSKITGDISKSIATGSPEIKGYANLIGVTAEEFKNMGAQDQILRIMEALQSMGPRAATELNRMGLDGTRSMRSITAVINQAGGLRQALGMAEIGADSGAAAEGAGAAMSNLSDSFGELREEMKMTAESMATLFGPMVEGFVNGIEKIAQNINEVMEGPLGEFIQVIMAVVAPLAGGAGAMLLFAGALLKVAAAFAVWRNSMVLGAREGFRGGTGITGMPGGGFGARGGGMLGERGAQLAEGGTWAQRGMYNLGQPVGSLAAVGTSAIRRGWQTGRAWADPNYSPGPARSILSYAAGGVGRGLQQFINPQFDQMRYADPTKRTQWVGQFAPWARMSDQERISGAMGRTATATTDAETAKAVYTSMKGAQGATEDQIRAAKTAAIQAESQRRVAVRSEEATLKSVDATQRQTREVTSNTTGFTRLRQSVQGFGAGAGGALGGGLRAGVGALGRSGMAPQLGAGLAMAGMAGTGIESNTLMMGAMGTMFLPGWGTAIGAATGLAMDMAGANDDAADSIKNVSDQADAAAKSGSGLTELNETSIKARDNIEELKKSWSVTSKDYWGLNPMVPLGSAKNAIEGIFGNSDIEEMESNLDRADKKMQDTEQTLRDLAEATGTSITGTRSNQLKQLQEFAGTTGAQRLSESGIDLDTLVGLRNKSGPAAFFGGKDIYKDLIGDIAAPGTTTGLNQRLRAGGGVGAMMVNDPVARQSLKYQGDIALFYEATNKVFDKAIDSGKSYLDIMKEAETAQQTIGVEDDRRYSFQMALAQKAQQGLAIQAQSGTRVQAFQGLIGQAKVLEGITPQTQEQAEQLESMKTATATGFADQANYFKQLLLAQDQYELSRSRAQEDYSLQQMYQMQDFNIQRARAEENFNRMRARAVADFHRSEQRAYYDYNLSRKRAEADFHHSVQVMATQQAQSVYDIYDRVDAKRTSSASWVLSNAQDQLSKLREQTSNLDELRRRGLSNQAIQQLHLADPEQAQQLARFVTELTPQMISQFNKVAGKERVKAAKDLVTDPGNLEWAEMRRGFRQQMSRTAEDFERQMRQSRQDFRRGLAQQREDFNIMMDQQAEDFHRQMGRQEKAYKTQMDRSAEDMANMANEISLSLEDILVQSATRLTGSAKTQAQQVLKAFQDLKKDTTPEAIAIMKDLSAIFGFEYKVPKLSPNTTSSTTGPGTNTAGGTGTPGGAHHGGSLDTHADGGVLPGYTPGRDVHQAMLSGGEAIMRPEWARAMGETAINAMNHQAKYGGYAGGGVFRPINVPVSRGLHDQYTGYAAVDLSAPVGTPVYAVRSGNITRSYDIAGPLASDTYHDPKYGPYGSYGRVMYLSTDGGPTVLYAHLSQRGFGAGAHVSGGTPIGKSGSTGNSSGPHLHFGDSDGNPYEFTSGQSGTGTTSGGVPSSGDGTSEPSGPSVPESRHKLLKKLLKDLYPKSEAAAKAMDGVHPLFPGDISKVINRFARSKINELLKVHGSPWATESETGDGTTTAPPGAAHMDNQQLVRKAMRQAGFSGQWPSLYQLVMHESGFRNTAQNPTSTAYGMFQFLDSTWAGTGIAKTSDPWLQAVAGLRYVKNRYNDPNGAWDFWQRNHWYGDGAVFNGPQTIGVGEKGPEAVIPLNARGADFMTEVMGSVMRGRNSAPIRNASNFFATKIDSSTNFTGPITVQANDPMELLSKLQSRQRVRALSRPSLTGSAA